VPPNKRRQRLLIPVVTRVAKKIYRYWSIDLICPFLPRVFLLSVHPSERWMVGAVGIENNADWNFKNVEEMLGSAKALKRNNRECEGILIGPSMAPHFFPGQ
jgi:hypothetical protein